MTARALGVAEFVGHGPGPLRMQAHEALDRLWKQGVLERRAAYALLAVVLDLPPGDAHIKHLDDEQCRKLIAACSQFRAAWEHNKRNGEAVQRARREEPK